MQIVCTFQCHMLMLACPTKSKPCCHENHTKTKPSFGKRKTNTEMTGKVILPDMGDSTMFPDLWTSSNLLKMTFSLDTERRFKAQQMSPQFCHPKIHRHVLRCLLGNFTGKNHKLYN